MVKTWFEEEAENMLRERGEAEQPGPIYKDIAKLCDRFYQAGIREGGRRLFEKAQHLQNELSEFLRGNKP